MSGRARSILTIAAMAVFTACGTDTRPPVDAVTGPILVSAASDLALALREIADAFHEETGIVAQLNLGSTGLLAQQIAEGAPVDLFLAADSGFIGRLEREGHVLPETRATYALGVVAIWSRRDSPVPIERIEDLARPEVRRIAIANPDHAPYGHAAREALRAAGIWEAVRERLVYGENVRQAQQHAEMGNADAALTALPLTRGLDGRAARVHHDLHPPLVQQLAVVRGTARTVQARAFAGYILGPAGRRILEVHGFEVPAP